MQGHWGTGHLSPRQLITHSNTRVVQQAFQMWLTLHRYKKFEMSQNNLSSIQHELEDVKDVTLVKEDSKANAHKVILVALSSFFRNSVSLKVIIIIGKCSINRVRYPNAFNYYTITVTQGHCTERYLNKSNIRRFRWRGKSNINLVPSQCFQEIHNNVISQAF